MKISIEETAKEMARLHRLANQFDEADTTANCSEGEGVYLELAAKEAGKRIENLKQVLTFQRPDTMRDVLILALIAANHGEQMGPTPLHKLFPNAPAELRHNSRVPVNHSFDQYMEPVLRLLDAIISGIEAQEKVSRKDLGLQFLRLREDDPEEMFERALKGLAEHEEATQQTKKAA